MISTMGYPLWSWSLYTAVPAMFYCICLHSGKCPGCDAKHNGCVHNSIFLYRANGVLFFKLMTLQWALCPEENTSKSARSRNNPVQLSSCKRTSTGLMCACLASSSKWAGPDIRASSTAHRNLAVSLSEFLTLLHGTKVALVWGKSPVSFAYKHTSKHTRTIGYRKPFYGGSSITHIIGHLIYWKSRRLYSSESTAISAQLVWRSYSPLIAVSEI